MMTPIARFAAIAAAAMLTLPVTLGAATPIRVTRFHLNQPIVPGAVVVQIAPDATVTKGPESDLYTDAVARALIAQGFTRAADATPADYTVIVSISRNVEDLPPAPPPVSIGLGGGGYGGGVGGGGGVSFGVGKRKPRALVTTQISVRMTRGGAVGEVIWEGRAAQAAEERGKPIQPSVTADKMAKALFKGFPGESGRTISIK